MDTLHYTISITETELINLSDAIIQARVQAITIMEDNKQDANIFVIYRSHAPSRLYSHITYSVLFQTEERGNFRAKTSP